MKKTYSAIVLFLFLASGPAFAQCVQTFYDSFESGSYTPTWTMGSGLTSATVNTTNPAVGSYRIDATGGTTSHLTGLSTSFTAANPSYMSWYINPSGSAATNYFVAGNSAVTATNCIVFCYWVGGNSIRFVSSTTLNYTASAGNWYHIELRNINWTSHNFDIYINNVLFQTAFPFRSATQNDVSRVHLYNFNSGNATWDDILIGNVPVTVTSTSTNVTCNGGSNGSIDITPGGGNGVYTYSWSNSASSQDISGLTAGTYSVTVTDGIGCTQTTSVTITQPTPITTTTMQTNVSCNGGANGDAMVMASGGTGSYSYLWSNASTSASASGLIAGTYTVIVTDANSCSVTQTVTITEPAAIAINTMQTNVSCNGGNNGDAMAMVTGGTGTYTYSWSSGGTNATESNLAAGTYTVTVTDANSCTGTQTLTITEPTAIAISMAQTNVNCNGGNSGDATAVVSGGTGSYTYSWSSGGTNANETNLAAGTYTLTVTDANNCIATETVTITEPAAVTSAMSQTDVTCNGGSNGSATVSAGGGTGSFSYSWSSGGTSATENNLMAGSYTVTITDSLGCTAVDSVTITEPVVLSISGTASNTTGCGASDGSIDITVSGGTPGYTYLWSDNSINEDLTAVPAGSYAVTVTDTNDCVSSLSFTIDDPAPPVVTFDNPNDSSCVNDGSFALTGGAPAGGTYSGPGVSAGMFNPANANAGYNVITYTYTAANGCTASMIDSIWVDNCSGISTVENAIRFGLYPNPTSGSVTIDLNAFGNEAMIEIFAADGKRIYTENSVSGLVQVNLGEATAGIYLVRVTGNGQSSVQKLVRE